MITKIIPLELTLAIIKPHIISNPVALQDIRNMIISNNFKIVKSKTKKMHKAEVETFYLEHNKKFFYNRLITFMSSGPVDLYIIARDNAILEWRKLMGPTKVFKTQFLEPNSIRGKYGLSDTRNATHGSDSMESARKEIKIFFPDFDFERWFREEEPLFRDDKNLEFDENRFVHFTRLKSKRIVN